jgi:hypothetical protein
VLDTFVYADKQLLQAYPGLLRAKVYVHFQSDVQVSDKKIEGGGSKLGIGFCGLAIRLTLLPLPGSSVCLGYIAALPAEAKAPM